MNTFYVRKEKGDIEHFKYVNKYRGKNGKWVYVYKQGAQNAIEKRLGITTSVEETEKEPLKKKKKNGLITTNKVHKNVSSKKAFKQAVSKKNPNLKTGINKIKSIIPKVETKKVHRTVIHESRSRK